MTIPAIKAALIADDFAAQFALDQGTMRGADVAAICITLAQVHNVTPEGVDRIQREHAIAGPT